MSINNKLEDILLINKINEFIKKPCEYIKIYKKETPLLDEVLFDKILWFNRRFLNKKNAYKCFYGI